MQYILHITKDCNFNCSYCYQKKTNEYMDKSIAINLIDYAYNDAIMNHKKTATISFYGGEPLLYKGTEKDTFSDKRSVSFFV